MKNQIDSLLAQDMTRKEFLQYAGGALLAAVGVTSIVKNLQGAGRIGKANVGYGASVYGGKKDTA